MRFHVVALPHTCTTKEFCACAYTQKALNFCKMMTSLGHEVIHYGAEGSEVPCEHVTIITAAEQQDFFGSHDWRRNGFPIQWNWRLPYWAIANARAAHEILRRRQPRDFLCLIGGGCQKPIADLMPRSVMVVEYGIGYRGVFAPYQVFESYTHQALVYGSYRPDPDGNYYHAVIPNYYDPADFPLTTQKGDYLLYVGRQIKRKGIDIAVAVARATGRKLLVAGQGQYPLDTKVCEFIGYLDVARRAELMGGAHALLCPTIYVEPFGGVAVEAQLCGTPAITTDWGAFSETVQPGVTGFRCRTLDQFVTAVNRAEGLNPAAIREAAMRYSIDQVRLQYEEYFQSLCDLWQPSGWGTLHRSGGI